MQNTSKRRTFIRNLSLTCTGCCLMTISGNSAISNFESGLEDEKIDPSALNYCGYKCPESCQFLKGSLENNMDLKKEAYKLWEIEKRFNVPFDPEKIFCFGCKTEDKPEGIVLVNCTVRSCAMEKNLDCCIECDELQDCEKELWERFPEFKKMVIEMQKKYNNQAV